jgi:hypothetical protein
MPNPKKRPLRVFLCHASADTSTVQVYYKRLRKEGIDVWLDEEDLIPGQRWREAVLKKVIESDIVIVCLSKNSINEVGYVQKVIKEALDTADQKPENTIFIIPALLECIEERDIPSQLKPYKAVDLFTEDGYDKLLHALKLQAKKIKAKPPGSQPSPAPLSETKVDELFKEASRLNLLRNAERTLQLYRQVKEIDPHYPNIDLEISRIEKGLEKGYLDSGGRINFGGLSRPIMFLILIGCILAISTKFIGRYFLISPIETTSIDISPVPTLTPKATWTPNSSISATPTQIGRLYTVTFVGHFVSGSQSPRNIYYYTDNGNKQLLAAVGNEINKTFQAKFTNSIRVHVELEDGTIWHEELQVNGEMVASGDVGNNGLIYQVPQEP